jgi:hypothetical protein
MALALSARSKDAERGAWLTGAAMAVASIVLVLGV